ncbi:hypothetical protein AP060_03357 [Pseudomonas sp. TAD18]|nr:hypothetical protein AP060_03357 [Pseudomonas sp. TAD18]KVV03999.1 hypothetical protein AP059_03575 [Pseudomonas sp. TAA207]
MLPTYLIGGFWHSQQEALLCMGGVRLCQSRPQDHLNFP